MEKYLSKNWLCCGFIGLFTLLMWGRTVGYDFVWDDEILVVQNQSIRSLRNIPQIFRRLEAQSSQTAPSFRPVRTSCYALLYALDGKERPRPWIFHLANVLWHGAAAMLVFLVAVLLWQRLEAPTGARAAALLLGLGFAAHPVNSETVCWIKCMDDLMAGVFVLAAAWSLLKWEEGKGGYVAALGWFLLAAFSKESAAPFAVAAFFIFYGFHKLSLGRSLRLTLPFLLLVCFYAAYRHWVMGRTTQYVPLSGTYGQTLIDMFPVATGYFRLFWGISPFCADYNYMVSQPVNPFFSSRVLGGMFLVLLNCGLAVWLWRKPGWRMAGFGLGWIGLFLLPVSNLLPMMQYMAERFLYLPLMGFLFALGGVALHLPRPRLAAVAGSALVVLWMSASLERMGIWKDNLTLFVRTELDFPGSQRDEKNAVSAIFHLPQMMALFPDYLKTGSWRMAETLTPAQAGPVIATLQEARRLFPDNEVFATELGFTEEKIGRWREAAAMMELAAGRKPGSAECWFNLAVARLGAGEPGNAAEACARALQLKPGYEEARRLQARIEEERKAGNIRETPAPK